MFSVIFEVLPNKENWDDYLNNAKMLRPELEQVEGFVDNIRYKSFASSATTGSTTVVKRPSTTLMRAARRQSTPNSPAGYTPAGGRRPPAIPAYPRVAAMPGVITAMP
jgi:hypothetical protein